MQSVYTEKLSRIQILFTPSVTQSLLSSMCFIKVQKEIKLGKLFSDSVENSLNFSEFLPAMYDVELGPGAEVVHHPLHLGSPVTHIETRVELKLDCFADPS